MKLCIYINLQPQLQVQLDQVLVLLLARCKNGTDLVFFCFAPQVFLCILLYTCESKLQTCKGSICNGR